MMPTIEKPNDAENEIGEKRGEKKKKKVTKIGRGRRQ